jgi:hypothetical protein
VKTMLIRVLATIAVAIALGQGAFAGGPVPACCICACAGFATECTQVADSPQCGAVFAACGQAMNATCTTGVNFTQCDLLPQCAAAPAVAPAPSLGVTGLAIAIVVLGSLAALRLRRRPARQRAR